MGYTHYWTQKRNFSRKDWQTIRDDISAILKYAQHEAGIPLADAQGEGGTSPEIDNNHIWFNGLGDDSHETMCIDRVRVLEEWQTKDRLGWAFCKTARKPYDPVVTACLCYLATITRKDDPVTGEPIIGSEAYSVTSDGSSADFLEGLELARKALPAKANMIDLPMALMQSDRWCAPWVNVYERVPFEVNFCVDGKGYVTRPKTGESYCFDSHLALAQFLQKHQRVDLGCTHFVRWNDRIHDSYRVEENIWNAFGSFDDARHKQLAKFQRRVLEKLFPVPMANAKQPPAYVRPGEMPENAGRQFCYSVADLLNLATAETAV